MEVKVKQMKSYYSSVIFGNSKMFIPRWAPEYALKDPEYFTPQKWTFLYDHSPIAKTLERYIDYDKLRPEGNSNARLILTAVNVLNARPLTFDSYKEQITAKHLLATSAYPSYNFRLDRSKRRSICMGWQSIKQYAVKGGYSCFTKKG